MIVNVVQTKRECASPISVDDPHSSHFLNLSGSMVLCCYSRLFLGKYLKKPRKWDSFLGAGGGMGILGVDRWLGSLGGCMIKMIVRVQDVLLLQETT